MNVVSLALIKETNDTNLVLKKLVPKIFAIPAT